MLFQIIKAKIKSGSLSRRVLKSPRGAQPPFNEEERKGPVTCQGAQLLSRTVKSSPGNAGSIRPDERHSRQQKGPDQGPEPSYYWQAQKSLVPSVEEVPRQSGGRGEHLEG